MIRRWSAASIRARLTGWYALVLLAMLIVYATATYIAVRHEFLEQLDEQLHDEFETAEGRLTRTADGRIAWRDEERHDADHEPERVFEVWSASGQQLTGRVHPCRCPLPRSRQPIAPTTTRR